MPILYLGLDPSRYPRKVVHYPVIRTVAIERLPETEGVTHFLFTSRSAVNHWFARIHGEVLAIGPGTAGALRERGIAPRVAPAATQEGMVELLETIDLSKAYVLWPRSASARPVIADYLRQKNVSFYALDLYRTEWQRPEPMPDLNDFDEIVFTSPSCIAAFLKVFGRIPTDKRLTPIGPVTEEALHKILVER